MADPFQHETVLKKETIEASFPSEAAVFELQKNQSPCLAVDCTLGGGGHAEEFLTKWKNSSFCGSVPLVLVGYDQDPAAQNASAQRLQPLIESMDKVRFLPLRDNFENVFSTISNEIPHTPLTSLWADFGVSSPQIDTGSRGFSFLHNGPLDMRMDPDGETTARDLVENASQDELLYIFTQWGEEPRARKLAQAIVEDRKKNTIPLESSVAFAEYCARVLAWHGSRVHPATRVFQALRIAVNREIEVIDKLMASVPHLMSPLGKSAFISFHSLEDRLVKQHMRAWENGEAFLPTGKKGHKQNETPWPFDEVKSWGKETPRGGITASDTEMQMNSRSRSARLRSFHFDKGFVTLKGEPASRDLSPAPEKGRRRK